MTRRVFLHIGLPKTGTTYLQGLLWSNKDRLKRSGVLLPGRGHRRHLLASLELREDPSLANRPGDVRAPWGDLVAEANAWRGDVLITHEFFAAAAPHQIRRAAESFTDADVHVVITARAMVDLGISRWQEWVRNGGTHDIDSYPPRADYDPRDSWGWSSYDLADVLERWGEVFPHDHLHVLPMTGSADPADLWTRFARVLGIDPAAVDVSESERNPSLGLVETELLRRVNPHLKGFRSAFDRGQWIRGFLAKPAVLAPSGEKFRPGDATLADLRQRGDRALAMLRSGGYDVVGDLALLEPGDVSGLRHPSEVTDGEMLEAAVRAIAALLEQVRAARQALRRSEVHGANGIRVTFSRLARQLASRISR